jgi:flagella basal body P-ring formation protein FlgA
MRILVLSLVMSLTAVLSAAEMRLQPRCTPQGTLVTLGDVAEISAAAAEQAGQLAAVELFPAPPAGQQRLLHVRELQDLLLLRGVNLAEHRLTGASEVLIAPAAVKVEPAGESPLAITAQKRSQRRLEEALTQYLKQKTGTAGPWRFRFELTAPQSRSLLNPAQSISLQGGQPPFIGVQVFDAAVQSPEGWQHFLVQVEVTVPAAVVTAVHSLSRGAVIRDTDVVLAQAEVREGESGGFHAIEDVVGKQTTRAIPEGKILTVDLLQAQSYVHRGEVITVHARAAGIRVRTTARAKDDGGLGDLIAVETLNDRKTFYARVCGIREAEVLAQGVAAERTW